MGARAAWAALVWYAFVGHGINLASATPINGIESFVRFETDPQFICEWQSHSFNLKTKFGAITRCTAASSKNIIVFHPSPQIPFLVGFDGFKSYCWGPNKRGVHFAIGTDHVRRAGEARIERMDGADDFEGLLGVVNRRADQRGRLQQPDSFVTGRRACRAGRRDGGSASGG